MSKITENTAVSLGAVAIFLGGIVWLSTVFAEVKHNGTDINELRSGASRYIELVESIDRRLARIEGKLNLNKQGE